MKKIFKYIGREEEYKKEYYKKNRDKISKQGKIRYRKLNPIEMGKGNGKGSKKTRFKKGFKWEEKFGCKKSEKMREDMGKLTKKNLTGKRPSKETKMKMSNSWDYDKHFTKESRKKMSESRKGEKNPNYGNGEKIKGEKNPAWLGGISFEPYGKEFSPELKEKIRKRDNYICQECNKTQEELKRKLSIHHIDFNKKNNNPLNLISLCLNCHIQTNNNRKHWERYFQMKMCFREMFNPENLLIFNENKQFIGIEKF